MGCEFDPQLQAKPSVCQNIHDMYIDKANKTHDLSNIRCVFGLDDTGRNLAAAAYPMVGEVVKGWRSCGLDDRWLIRDILTLNQTLGRTRERNTVN
jgi:hypothetical protein